ncbi:unnamed protein product, partial [Amoebophrya sp. A120]|eukprot:GSA120T00003919001.1
MFMLIDLLPLLVGLGSLLLNACGSAASISKVGREQEESSRHDSIAPSHTCTWCPSIIGLGNQKTGTTAVAHAVNFLLQEVGKWKSEDISLLVDPPEIDFIRQHRGRTNFSHPLSDWEICARLRQARRRDDRRLGREDSLAELDATRRDKAKESLVLVKRTEETERTKAPSTPAQDENVEQHLTILKVPSILPHLPRFQQVCPSSKFYHVIRSPLQNTRSLLDRLAHLGGDAQKQTMAGTLMTLLLHDKRPDLWQQYIAKTNLNDQTAVMEEAWEEVMNEPLEPQLLISVGIDPERLRRVRMEQQRRDEEEEKSVGGGGSSAPAAREGTSSQQVELHDGQGVKLVGKTTATSEVESEDYLQDHKTERKRHQVDIMTQYDLRDVQLRFDLEHQGRMRWESFVKKFAERHLGKSKSGAENCRLYHDLLLNIEHETWHAIVNETRQQISLLASGDRWRGVVSPGLDVVDTDGAGGRVAVTDLHLGRSPEGEREGTVVALKQKNVPQNSCVAGFVSRWIDFALPLVEAASGELTPTSAASAAPASASVYAQLQTRRKSGPGSQANQAHDDEKGDETTQREALGLRLRPEVRVLQPLLESPPEAAGGEGESSAFRGASSTIPVLRYEDFRKFPGESIVALVNALGIKTRPENNYMDHTSDHPKDFKNRTFSIQAARESDSFQHAARIQLQPRGWGHGKSLSQIFSRSDCRNFFGQEGRIIRNQKGVDIERLPVKIQPLTSSGRSNTLQHSRKRSYDFGTIGELLQSIAPLFGYFPGIDDNGFCVEK